MRIRGEEAQKLAEGAELREDPTGDDSEEGKRKWSLRRKGRSVVSKRDADQLKPGAGLEKGETISSP